jgi:hypothetical protein
MYFQVEHRASFTACCYVKQNGMNTHCLCRFNAPALQAQLHCSLFRCLRCWHVCKVNTCLTTLDRYRNSSSWCCRQSDVTEVQHSLLPCALFDFVFWIFDISECVFEDPKIHYFRVFPIRWLLSLTTFLANISRLNRTRFSFFVAFKLL